VTDGSSAPVSTGQLVSFINENFVTLEAHIKEHPAYFHRFDALFGGSAAGLKVIKRSMNPGFAGIDNPLYYLDKTLMLFGDARSFVNDIVHELAGSGQG
jgi:H+-translocating NAD(P) transhydrogenase subunit beta